jgi:hypothetical protein
VRSFRCATGSCTRRLSSSIDSTGGEVFSVAAVMVQSPLAALDTVAVRTKLIITT